MTLEIVKFLLAGVLGALIAYALKRRSWLEESKSALHQARLEEGMRFLDALSEAIGRRFFLLQRLLWSVKSKDTERLKAADSAYYRHVEVWNATLWMNRNKIRLLIGEAAATRFLDYKDDGRGESPKSLHYMFVVAHNAVENAKLESSCLSEAQSRVAVLNHHCSQLLEELTTIFLLRAGTLQLLQVPEFSLGGVPKGKGESMQELLEEYERKWDQDES